MSNPATYIGAHPVGRGLTGFFARSLMSPLVAASAAVTVLALTAISVLTIDADYLRDGATAIYWPRDAIDDYAFASLTAKRAGMIAGDRESVVLVGTAAMREGLLPGRDIEAILRQRTGRDVPVLNLLTGGQSPLEAAALVQEIAPLVHGTLVLAVSPSRMAASGGELQGLIDHPRLAFTNQGFRDEARALGLTVREPTGISLWDNRQFYVIRVPTFVRNLISGTAPVNDVQTYLSRGREDSDSWGRDMAILSSRLSSYDRNFPANIAPYRRLIHWIRDNNVPLKVVLLEIPLNPKAIAQATAPGFYDTHRANLESFCHDEGCRYVNVNTRGVMDESYFYDWSHLSSHQGKQVYTEAVLADILETP